MKEQGRGILYSALFWLIYAVVCVGWFILIHNAIVRKRNNECVTIHDTETVSTVEKKAQ